jgi:hypothetical protein
MIGGLGPPEREGISGADTQSEYPNAIVGLAADWLSAPACRTTVPGGNRSRNSRAHRPQGRCATPDRAAGIPDAVPDRFLAQRQLYEASGGLSCFGMVTRVSRRGDLMTAAAPDNPYSQGLAYVDGQICALADARLPLVEAGFTRSDVTYDVVAVWNGKFVRLEDHLARFARSRAVLRLSPPVDDAGIRRILTSLVGKARLRDAYISMIATRGIPLSASRDPRRYTNKVYAFASPTSLGHSQ